MPSSGFEKSVKGATKPKNAAPKSKYLEHILTATYSDAGVAEIFRTLQIRMRDSAWTIVFKSLIVVHMMIREGSSGAALAYLSQNSRALAISGISDVQTQGNNIWRYAEYLSQRAKAYGETRTDYVRGGQGRLKRLTVAKGLLRETEVVQKQIQALLKCELLTDEPENEITLTAFRLLTLDLLALFSVMNEGTINVLEHYFEMSRPDSERALELYKRFSSQTEDVVAYLRVARQFEHATRLEIPSLKHASTSLAKLLEDDLNDPDFTARRREYRTQKFGNKDDRGAMNGTSPKPRPTEPQRPATAPSQAAPKLELKTPAPDLIDFFESIDQTQTPQTQQPAQQYNLQNNQFQQYQQTGFQPQQTGFMPQQTGFQQPQQYMPTGFGQQQQPGFVQQQTGFAQQQLPQQTGFGGGQFGTSNSNPFGQSQPQQPQMLQPDHTGAGFGGYTPQPQQSHSFQSNLPSIPQNGVASFQQPMQTGGGQRATNPFRQSMLPSPDQSSSPQSAFSTNTPSATPLSRQSTNPFAKRLSQAPQFGGTDNTPFSSPPPVPTLQQDQQQQRPQTQPQPLQPQRTGTNPFARASPAPNNQQQNPVAAPLRPNPTGSTNPFRQSQFINQQTGQGWQSGPQGTMGGLENLPTMPVFPRPGQAA